MEESKLEEIINEKLKKFELPPLSCHNENIKQYLKKIESAIQTIIIKKEELLKLYKKQKMNKSIVSEKTNISRQTIHTYRNILDIYISESEKDFDNNDIIVKQTVLREKIEKLNRDIIKYQERDLESQLLLDIIEVNNKEKLNLQNELRNARELTIKIQNENKKLKEKLTIHGIDYKEKSSKLLQVFKGNREE